MRLAPQREGIVPGGGVAQARVSLVLHDLKVDKNHQRVGIEVARKALQTPMRQISEEAGEDGASITGKVLEDSASTYRAPATRTRLPPASSTQPKSSVPHCSTQCPLPR